ncbi:MAG: hypothetical protein DU481_01570 [Nitrosomonas sp.]|uniref:hypothetical protein n=1 Tax=Nitrosomonas sp. TaxID=42353 RepID=UPI0032F08EF4
MALITDSTYGKDTSGNDTIDVETFLGARSGEVINGGSGIDTAIFFGNSSSFNVIDLSGVVRVIGLSSAPDFYTYGHPPIRFLNVEKLQFLDRTIELTSPVNNIILKSTFVGEVLGTSGNDTIENYGRSASKIDGGAGIDTVVYFANSSDFSINYLSGVARITALSSAPESYRYSFSNVIHINVEKLQFLDKTIELDGSGIEPDGRENPNPTFIQQALDNQVDFDISIGDALNPKFSPEELNGTEIDNIKSAFTKIYNKSDLGREIIYDFFSSGKNLTLYAGATTANWSDPIHHYITVNFDPLYYIALDGSLQKFSLEHKVFHEFLHWALKTNDLVDKNGVPVKGASYLTAADYLTPNLDHLGETVIKMNQIMTDPALGEVARGGYNAVLDQADQAQFISSLASLDLDLHGSFDQVIYMPKPQIDTSGRLIEDRSSNDLIIMWQTWYTSELKKDEKISYYELNNLSNPKVSSGSGDDVIVGLRGVEKQYSDRIDAGAGADRIYALEGDDVILGGAGDDVIIGGGGIDTASYSGPLPTYVIQLNLADKLKVIDQKLAPGSDGTDTLQSIERLIFTDVGLALDLDGSAGKVAKLIGAVFGAESVSNKGYVAIGLHYLDNDTSYEDLAALAIGAAGAKTPEEVVALLWNNVAGSAPTADQVRSIINDPDLGKYTAGELGVYAAGLSHNLANINLVGLQETGIVFDPAHYHSLG